MARDVATESTCIGCKETKPADQFTRHPRMASGLRSRCRACTSVQARQWQSSNAAEVLRRHLEKHYGIKAKNFEVHAYAESEHGDKALELIRKVVITADAQRRCRQAIQHTIVTNEWRTHAMNRWLTE